MLYERGLDTMGMGRWRLTVFLGCKHAWHLLVVVGSGVCQAGLRTPAPGESVPGDMYFSGIAQGAPGRNESSEPGFWVGPGLRSRRPSPTRLV